MPTTVALFTDLAASLFLDAELEAETNPLWVASGNLSLLVAAHVGAALLLGGLYAWARRARPPHFDGGLRWWHRYREEALRAKGTKHPTTLIVAIGAYWVAVVRGPLNALLNWSARQNAAIANVHDAMAPLGYAVLTAAMVVTVGLLVERRRTLGGTKARP